MYDCMYTEPWMMVSLYIQTTLGQKIQHAQIVFLRLKTAYNCRDIPAIVFEEEIK